MKSQEMREKILRELKELRKDLLEQFGIEEITVFGSVARGDCTPESDVDIVILRMKEKNLFLRFKAREFLEENLGIKVDLGLYSALHPFIRKRIKQEMIRV